VKLKPWAYIGITFSLALWTVLFLSWITGSPKTYNSEQSNNIFYGLTSIITVVSVFLAFAGLERTQKEREDFELLNEIGNSESSNDGERVEP
jgi:hypothetical protein